MAAIRLKLVDVDRDKAMGVCIAMVVHEFVQFETLQSATMLIIYQNGKIFILSQ